MKLSDFGLCKPVDVTKLPTLHENEELVGNRWVLADPSCLCRAYIDIDDHHRLSVLLPLSHGSCCTQDGCTCLKLSLQIHAVTLCQEGV